MEPTFFDDFVDGEPLTPGQREQMLLLINRLKRIPVGTAEMVSRRPLAVAAITDDPAQARGDLFSILGTATEVTRENVPAEDQERLGFDTYYRCTIQSLGVPITLYARHIPGAWALDKPLNEPCGVISVFLQTLPRDLDEDNRQTEGVELLFVADRVGWYPDELLGHLDMDVSLFEDVQDRKPLKERECFYQLLAAVRSDKGGRIEKAGRQRLTEERKRLEALVGNPDVDAKARAAAERGMERIEQGALDVVPLFNEPAKQRGELFVLAGEALRAIRVRVDDEDIQRRFGIDHYYEVEIVTPDSQNNPIVCCVAELPPGMPTGESIHENVRVTGFFLKSWAFNTRTSLDSEESPGEAKRKQLAPLLVAKTIQWLPSRAIVPPQSVKLAVGLLAAILALGVAMWLVRRSDRQAHAQVESSPGSTPPHVSLDHLHDKSDDGA
ncbi:MAG: hypothetical protein DWQ37_08940 [Planctomycetota bacterium]|nr:MAG: hypothetical protein DWQ37_08940 [Planctomycetota bacterium]